MVDKTMKMPLQSPVFLAIVLWAEYLCPPKIHVDALTPSVIVFGGGAFGR